MKRFCMWTASLLLIACPGGKPPPLPDLPQVDLSALPLPKSIDGKYVLMEAAASRLELDPTASDAITAVGACTDLVTYCVTGGGTLDECVKGARECATARPWEERSACCAAACKTAYQTARQGAEPIEAFEQSFFLQPTCHPGLAAALEGQP